MLPRFGGPDVFELRAVWIPPVGNRQVRVRIHATAVNPLDCQIRRGDYVDDVPLPAITGHDVSGVVEEIGADVTSLTLVGGTVWEALVTRAQVQVGETVLVHGGAGGVGSIAIQVAKAMGARVLTTARKHDRAFVEALGADAAIDVASEDYVESVTELTGGVGVDVVFDTIGGDALTRSPLALADAGRVVSIVDTAEPQDLVAAWGKNAAYHFVFTRQNRGKLDALTGLVERGLVKPVVGAVLPFTAVGEAHDLLERGGVRGKVAIDVSGEAAAAPARQALALAGAEG